MTIDQIKTLIGQWVTAQGQKPVWLYQNAPSPVAAHVGLYGPRIVREGRAIDVLKANTSLTLKELTAVVYAVYVTFTAYSRTDDAEAHQLALDLHALLQTPKAARALAPLVIVEVETDVQQIPLLNETQFKGRAEFTARFRMVVEQESVIDIIESANIDGTLNGSVTPKTVHIEVHP